MYPKSLFLASFLMVALSALALTPVSGLAAEPADTQNARKAPQVIILKLDDVTPQGAHGSVPVSARWQRVADFVEQNHIKAAFGIIGYSLEQDNQAYFNWIRRWNKKGIIEFWNHGYLNRKAEDKAGEFERSYEEQKSSLEKTQRLSREKLGIELNTFGAHWSGTNDATARALAGIPEIRMVFYDPPVSGKHLFKRVLTIENPTFVPDFEKFKTLYMKNAKNEPCLALQGHPNAWDDARWAGFVKIIQFLKEQNCVFMTPSEYLAQNGSRK